MLSVILFYDNSGTSKIQNLFFTNLQKEFSKKVDFKKVDADKNKDALTKYQIVELPTIVVESHGRLKEKFSGLTQETFLRKAIERNMD